MEELERNGKEQGEQAKMKAQNARTSHTQINCSGFVSWRVGLAFFESDIHHLINIKCCHLQTAHGKMLEAMSALMEDKKKLEVERVIGCPNVFQTKESCSILHKECDYIFLFAVFFCWNPGYCGQRQSIIDGVEGSSKRARGTS